MQHSRSRGDDGNLSIATGDGGASDDAGTGHIEPGGNAQNTTTLLGKMLRIHIEAKVGTYSIPPNNPFANSSTSRKEIFCYGLRNPFRNSFDRLTGDLFIGDVGQGEREEVDVQPASNPGGGENYGWRVREGTIQNPAYPNGRKPGEPDVVRRRRQRRALHRGYHLRGHLQNPRSAVALKKIGTAPPRAAYESRV